MTRFTRRTTRSEVKVRGLGLFTGQHASVRILPGEPGTGIQLEHEGHTFPARIAQLTDQVPHPIFRAISPRCTSLASLPRAVGGEGDEGGHGVVHTLEHIMSALRGLGITDALCVVEGPEIPIVDGSAKPFVEALFSAGLVDLDEPLEPIRVTSTIEVRSPDGSASVRIEPSDEVSYTYELDFGAGAPLQSATVTWDGIPESYIEEVAPARTFSHKAEAEAMQDHGLFRAFSPADLPVVDTDGSLVDNAWRFTDEPARHKLLDLIGDLALTGAPILGCITACRAGHALNHAAARAVLDASGQKSP